MSRKLSKEEVVNRFKEIHGDKYDYSKFNYINSITKGVIICPKHGEFLQSANVHLRGAGCPVCARNEANRTSYKLSKEKLLERLTLAHGGKYEYDLSDYSGTQSKVGIKCPLHGWFKQTIANHLYMKQGCPVCAREQRRIGNALSKEEFIERVRERYGDKYDYSKVDYKNRDTEVIIICPKHGEFKVTPVKFLNGNACTECVREEFIGRAINVHGDRYDYSKLKYTDSNEKITIICNKCGREFQQAAYSHLQGHGCPYCRESKLEREVEDYLKNNNVNYVRQMRFKWLGRQSLDFYLPDINTAIECQGEQHFRSERVFWGNGAITLESIIERDTAKNRLCHEHGIRLLYYVREQDYRKVSNIYTEENVIYVLNKVPIMQ